MTDTIGGSAMTNPACCDAMRHHVGRSCATHEDDPWACPDFALAALGDGTWGIPIRDGGNAIYAIRYCPWCASPMPKPDVGRTIYVDEGAP